MERKPFWYEFRLNDLENQNGRLQSEKQYLYKIAQ